MANKPRVYMNIGDHPIYASLRESPPPGFLYENLSKEDISASKLEIYKKSSNIKRKLITRITATFGIPRMFLFETDADLIHTSRGIIPLNKKPWVMDIEHAKSFFDSHTTLDNRLAVKLVRRFLLADNCKKVMPHCKLAAHSMVSAFGADLEKKMEVVYPAIKLHKVGTKKNNMTVTLLFMANKFFEKGGKEVLEAFDVLSGKYDVELVFKCRAPPEFKRKYSRNEQIQFVESSIPYAQVFQKLYGRADVFLFPSYIDTFGFSLLEAMSCGVPSVATNIFAIPEIVEDGKTGLLVDAREYDWAGPNGLMKPEYIRNPRKRMSMYDKDKPDTVKQLVEKISILVEDGRSRRAMARSCLRVVGKGKFSVKERNKRLAAVYKVALRE